MTGQTGRIGVWQRRARRLLLGLLIFAVLGEIAVRIWDGAHGGTGSLYDFVVPEGSRFKLRSGASVLVPERYGDVRYRFNRAGYRDGEPERAPGVRRIVVLGDSVSFGLGVDQEAIWPSLLEQRLRREGLRPDRVENLAIFAYNSAHELDALREDGLALRPELVILQFYLNDFAISSMTGPTGAVSTWANRLTAIKNRIVYKSALYRRVHQAWTGLTFLLVHDLRRSRFPETLNDAEPQGKSAYLRATPRDEDVEAFGKIRAIRDLAHAQGAPLLLVVSPDETQLFSGRYDEINRRIRAFCASAHIAVLDPLPVYRASPERLDLFLDGVHYSRTGHELLARLIAAELERLRLVRREGT